MFFVHTIISSFLFCGLFFDGSFFYVLKFPVYTSGLASEAVISDVGPKLVRMTQNGTNPGLFHMRFQYISAHWEKVPDLFRYVPFRPIFYPKSDIPDWFVSTLWSDTRRPDLAPKWVRLDPNGTNQGIFQIRFSTFWLGEPKCTESDLKNPRICPICGLI